MSLFYMTVKIISKSKQSAVASASYRSGESLFSERDKETKSYREREVKPDSFILAPNHAPEWVYVRERLWNEVESVEKNWNARLAREILVALPVELTNDVQKELLRDFVNENFVSDGMVADVSIHRDRIDNPHAHIMLTVRPFNEDGSWGNKKKKEYTFDENGNNVFDKNGKKSYKTIQLTEWDKTETLVEWRKNLADKINEYYQRYDIAETVSHESYEKQGLDILPKQRLTRKEYAIEKNEKEKVLKNGQKYEPKTYYAKINKEIEKANKEIKKINKEIEITNQKVVSLTDYREYKNEQIDKLDQIRNNANLSSSDWKSLKIVANRTGGFIDYNKAKDNLNKLDNWKKKLDYKSRILSAEEKVLTKARYTFEKEPSKTLLYGFIPNKFKEDFIDKVNIYKQMKQENDKAFKAFNELYNHSKRAFEIQKEFVNEEFNIIYPEYKNKLDDNEKVFDLKSKYVDLFRNEGKKRQISVEFESDKHKFTNSYISLESLIKDWKDTYNSLVILERTKDKQKAEYRNNYKEYNAQKTYNSSIRYTDSKDQITMKEEYKEELKEKLFEQMALLYPNIPNDDIKIPSEIQARVLELHLSNQHTGKLSEDLKTVIKEITKKDKEYNNNIFNENRSSSARNDTSMVIDSLINICKDQETRDKNLEEKRRDKNKPRKLLHKELEREM